MEGTTFAIKENHNMKEPTLLLISPIEADLDTNIDTMRFLSPAFLRHIAKCAFRSLLSKITPFQTMASILSTGRDWLNPYPQLPLPVTHPDQIEYLNVLTNRVKVVFDLIRGLLLFIVVITGMLLLRNTQGSFVKETGRIATEALSKGAVS